MLALKRKRCRVRLTDWLGQPAVMCITCPSHRHKDCHGILTGKCFKEC